MIDFWRVDELKRKLSKILDASKNKLTFFFKSTRFRESVLAMTVRATKSLYESSSVAVKVERTSSSSSPPCLNWRMEMR